MKKRFGIIGMLAVMALWGCGQGEKQDEAPPAATAPAAVEQAVQQAQQTADAAAKQAEQAATAVQEKAAAVQKQAEAVVAKGEKAAADAKASAEKILAPETVTLNPKQGTITLPHKKHADAHGCKTCHGDQTPGPLALGKEKGHALCLGCHKKMQAGPTSCTKCHQKKG